MSAIFLQYDTTGIDVDAFTDCFHVLNDRGPDGRDCFIDHTIAIGCQHLAAIAPSRQHTQPVIDTHHVFAFDGRVDNRQALVRDYAVVERDMDDMEIFISLFKQYDIDSFSKIVGPFFAVVYEPDTQRLVCGRDTMGLRHIFYAPDTETVSIASSPDAILATPHGQYPPDRTAIAGYLSQNSIYAEPSFYDGIETLGRGSYLVCTPDSCNERRYHTFTSQQTYSRARPDKFRAALNKAIAARSTGETQPAIALSGGRDSNTIASVLVEQFDSTPKAYSHVSHNDFDNERIQTEMNNIDIVKDKFDLESTRINIDDYEFKYDVCHNEYSFGLPVLDPYLHMQVQLYRNAADHGTILLDGFGGNCFDGAGFHYYDLLKTGQLRQFVQRAYRDDGTMAAHVLSAILPVVTAITARVRTPKDPAWLLVDPPRADIAMDVPSLEQRFMLRFILKHAKNIMRFQARNAALKHGIDLRFPLMDERLHREVLQMPLGSLRTGGRVKGLFLDAVDGILPPEVEAFTVGMPFDSFLRQGLANHGHDRINRATQTLRTGTLGIVDEAAVRYGISNYTNETDNGDFKAIHLWKVLTMENWLQRHDDRTNSSVA